MKRINQWLEKIEEQGIEASLFLLGVVLFTPDFPLPGRLPAVRIEEILTPILLVILWRKRHTFLRVIRRPMNVLLILLGAVMAISTVNAVALQGARLSFGDLMEFVRVFKYLVLYSFMVTMIAESPEKSRAFHRLTGFMDKAVIALLAINWFQYFNFLYFNRWFSPLYGPAHHVERIIRNSRVIGTFGNPNFFGALMMMILLFYFAKFLYDLEGFNRDRRKNLFLIVATWMSLLLTVSRTAILAAVGGIVVAGMLFLLLKKGRGLKNLAAMVAMFIVLGFVSNFLIVFSMTAYEDVLRPGFFAVRYGVEDLYFAARDRFFTGSGEPGEDTEREEREDERMRSRTTHSVAYRMQDTINEGRSVWARFDVWEVHFARAQESILIGNGPQKEVFQDEAPVDNEYLLILRRYGILGLVLYGGLFAHVLVKFPGGERKEWFYVFLFSSTAGLMAFNIAAGSFYHLQLFPVYIGLVAFYDGVNLRKPAT